MQSRTKEVLFVEIFHHQAVEHIFGADVSTCVVLDMILGAGGSGRTSLMKVITCNLLSDMFFSGGDVLRPCQ
jgi:hypothetical protein